jgi:hypothetical protein
MSEVEMFVNTVLPDTLTYDVHKLEPHELSIKSNQKGAKEIERLPNLANSLYGHLTHLLSEGVADGFKKWPITALLARVGADPRTYEGTPVGTKKLDKTLGSYYARFLMNNWPELFGGTFNLREQGPRIIRACCPRCAHSFDVALTAEVLADAEARKRLESTNGKSDEY